MTASTFATRVGAADAAMEILIGVAEDGEPEAETLEQRNDRVYPVTKRRAAW
jgi:hypothetical protein